MRWLIVEGLKPWDGRYELPPIDEWKTRDWGWIKRFTGYLPLTIDDGLDGADAQLHAVLVIIALHHAGRIADTDVQALWERFEDIPPASVTRIAVDQDHDEPEDDAGPPAVSSNGSSSASGPDTKTSSGMWAPPAGTPASATSESAPLESPT